MTVIPEQTEQGEQKYPSNLLEMVRDDFHSFGRKDPWSSEEKHLFRCILGLLIPFSFVTLFMSITYPDTVISLVAVIGLVFLVVTTCLGIAYCIRMFLHQLCFTGGLSICGMMIYAMVLIYGLGTFLEWMGPVTGS